MIYIFGVDLFRNNTTWYLRVVVPILPRSRDWEEEPPRHRGQRSRPLSRREPRVSWRPAGQRPLLPPG